MTEIIIIRRFRGPPNSGNGGYVCGMLANAVPKKDMTSPLYYLKLLFS